MKIKHQHEDLTGLREPLPVGKRCPRVGFG